MNLKLLQRLLGFRSAPHESTIRDHLNNGQWEKAQREISSLSKQHRGAAADSRILAWQGEAAFGLHQDEEAERCLRLASSMDPALAEAHHGLSLIFSERGDTQLALKHAAFATGAKPNEARFAAQLGYCHLLLGNLQAASGPLTLAGRLAPQNPYIQCNLGLLHMSQGNLEAAQQCFQNAVAIKPGFHRATENLEKIKQANSEPNTTPHLPSLDELEDRLANSPDDTELAIALYSAYKNAGDTQSGLDALQNVFADKLDSLTKHWALGFAYLDSGQYALAEQHLKRSLELAPDNVALQRLYASTLIKRQETDKALYWLDRALSLAPGDLPTLASRAATLTNLCRYEEALNECERHFAEAPMLFAGSFGSTLAYLGRNEEALEKFDIALGLQPNDPNLRFLRGASHLLSERFAQGWDDYQFRNFQGQNTVRVVPAPEWQGESLEGRHIVVIAEQGLGDQIMFASCIPDLLHLNPKLVSIEAIDRVAETLARSFPACRVIPTAQDRAIDWLKNHEAADYFVHLADLPRHFRRTADAFPRHSGYLQTDPAKNQRWASILDDTLPSTRKPRIGISWRGGVASTRATVRTISLDQIIPMLLNIDAHWVNLQYGPVEKDLAQIRAAGIEVVHWDAAISDLDNFASLITQLDLVITVCNTTVHYAGALGKDVWVMSPHVPEWRYGLTRRNMLWYPSSRMFRQHTLNDWPSVINDIITAWHGRQNTSVDANT